MTEKVTLNQIRCVVDAWEEAEGQWEIVESRGWPINWWIVMPNRKKVTELSGDAVYDMVYHKFEHRSLAKLFVREKIAIAILEALLKSKAPFGGLSLFQLRR